MKKSVKDSVAWMANYVFWHAVIGAVAIVGGLKFMDIDLTRTLDEGARKCADAGSQKGRCMADFLNANPPLMIDKPEEFIVTISGDEVRIASVFQQVCTQRKGGDSSIFGGIECERRTVYYPAHNTQ